MRAQGRDVRELTELIDRLRQLEAGRAFNEAYLVRAFLSFNDAFRVVLFNTFLEHFHEARFAARMPLCLRNTGGSLWLARR